MKEDSGSCCQSASHSDGESQENAKEQSFAESSYRPLLIIVLLSLLSASAMQFGSDGWDGRIWMHDFMGLFLVIFAMVKFFDLRGFAKGFQKYDLLAAVSMPYALIYPFLELALGLGYLSKLFPEVVYVATVVLLTFGSLGVLNSMRQGKKLRCACMGSILNVPVSVVTLTEDLGMALMALVLLLT